jgi:hypothetical protein
MRDAVSDVARASLSRRRASTSRRMPPSETATRSSERALGYRCLRGFRFDAAPVPGGSLAHVGHNA